MRLLLSFLILNSVGAGLLVAAGLHGLLEKVWLADNTHLSVVIFGVFLVGLGLAALRVVEGGGLQTIRFISGTLVYLGLIGTVLGFIIALGGVKPDIVGDVAAIGPMVSILIGGMSIALYTTLVGTVLSLWLSINVRMIEALRG